MKLIQFLITISIIFFMLGCNNKESQNSAISKELPKYPSKIAQENSLPKKDADQILDVIGSEIFIRSGPGKQFPKIINEKGTKALNSTQYIQIDSSTKVIEDEKKDGWSKIRLVEPEYLRDSHKGWIPSSTLKYPALDRNGIKIYNESDIDWNSYIKPHKKIIIEAINQIARQIPKEATIDTFSIFTSPDKGTKSDPLFFVSVGEFPKSYNVYFTKHDVETKSIKLPSKNISKEKAIELCMQYVKSRATHPSTVEFSSFDLTVDDHPNGRTAVTGSFNAKNDFNLLLKYRYNCLLDNKGIIEGNITEAR